MPLRRTLALAAAAALLTASPVGAAITFAGFSPQEEATLRADVAASTFPLAEALDAEIVPGDLPPGVVGQAESRSHRVTLDPVVWQMSDAARTFVVLHELAHQVDFQLLANPERQEFYAAAGFGAGEAVSAFWDEDWNHGPVADVEAHASSPAEQWASAFPLVVWPGTPFVAGDGACVGWGRTKEGCRAPLASTRAVVEKLSARLGFAAPAPPPQTAPPPATATEPAQVVVAAGLASRRGAPVVLARFTTESAALRGATVVVEIRPAAGEWRRVTRLRTNRAGIVRYRLSRRGERPAELRLSFAGTATLAAASVVVSLS
jgi:hypothetical protein